MNRRAAAGITNPDWRARENSESASARSARPPNFTAIVMIAGSTTMMPRATYVRGRRTCFDISVRNNEITVAPSLSRRLFAHEPDERILEPVALRHGLDAHTRVHQGCDDVRALHPVKIDREPRR